MVDDHNNDNSKENEDNEDGDDYNDDNSKENDNDAKLQQVVRTEAGGI